MEEHKSIWESVLQIIKNKLPLPSYKHWVECTHLQGLNESEKIAIIVVPDEFVRDWLEARYKTLFEETLYEVTKSNYQVVFVLETTSENGEMEYNDKGEKYERLVQRIERLEKQQDKIEKVAIEIASGQRRVSQLLEAMLQRE